MTSYGSHYERRDSPRLRQPLRSVAVETLRKGKRRAERGRQYLGDRVGDSNARQRLECPQRSSSAMLRPLTSEPVLTKPGGMPVPA